MTHRFTDAQIVALLAYVLGHPDENSALVAFQAAATSDTPLLLLLRRALEAHTPDALVMSPAFEHLCDYGRADLVVRLVLEHENSRVRSAAASALGRRPDARFITVLTQALKDSARNVALSAKSALARVQEHSGPPPRVRVIPPLTSRARVIAGLILDDATLAGDPPALIALLGHKSREIRGHAQLRLRSMPRLDVDAALSVVATMPQPLTPEMVAFLGSTGDRRAIEHIARAGVSLHAIKALRELASEEAIGVLVAWAVELSLQPRHETYKPLTDAIAKLGHQATPAAVRAFREHPIFRRNGAAMLGALGGPLALEALLEAVRDPHRAVRLAAEDGLQTLGAPAVEPLLHLLQETGELAREHAVRVLGKIRDPRAVEPLVALLRAGRTPVRMAVIQALELLRDPRSADALAEAFRDDSSEIRLATLRALTRIDTPRSREILAIGVADPAWEVRSEAVTALGHVGGPAAAAAAETVIKALVDDHPSVVSAALAALVNLGDPAAQAIEHALMWAGGTLWTRLQDARTRIEHEARRRREHHPLTPSDSLASRLTPRGDARVPDPAEIPAPISDHLQFSVSAPCMLRPGSSFVLQVWAHTEFERSRLLAKAREAHATPNVHIQSKGTIPVARGTTLNVRLHIPGLGIAGEEDTILWTGTLGNATFGLTIPADLEQQSLLGRVLFFVGAIQIARLDFVLFVGAQEQPVDDVASQELRIKHAFASYASEDRDEVLGRIQGMQKVVPNLDVFIDVASLRSGDKWMERLQQEIATRDVFYLFWSLPASRSHWVEQEWRTALARRGLEFIDPVPLASPTTVPPPPELASLHFNEWTLAFMTRD